MVNQVDPIQHLGEEQSAGLGLISAVEVVAPSIFIWTPPCDSGI